MGRISAEHLITNAGEDAALAGKPRSDNPYPSDVRMLRWLHAWWDAGWLSVTDAERAEVRETL